ncbi:MAG: oligosaccharide flippase family protein, partial [candidate division WOR-3 bacterium]|nr:oligosaccharide flippase family protein [candidate division WOR-3 bacterium]
MTENTQQPPGKSLIIGSGYSYISLLVNKFIGVFTSIFLARSLGPHNLGIISIINYLLLLMLFFTGFGIPTAIVKLIPEIELKKGSVETNKFIILGLVLNFLIIGILSILYFVLSIPIAKSIYHEPKLIPLIQLSVIALLVFSFNQYGNAIIQGLAEFKKLSLLSMFTSIFGLIILIPSTKFLGLKGPVIAQGINSIITSLLLILTLKKIRGDLNLFAFPQSLSLKEFRKENSAKLYWQKLLSTAFPIFLSGLVMTPALTILTTILSRLQGFSAVGFFNIAYSLTQFILFVPTAVGTAFIPLASKLAIEDEMKLNNFLIKTIFGVDLIVITLAFFISFFSKEIILLFYGKSYYPVQSILILLSIASFISSFGYVFGYYLISTNQLWFATILNLIWFLVIIAPTPSLIKHFQLNGLGLSYIIAYIILGGVSAIFIGKKNKIKMNYLLMHLIGGIILLVGLFFVKIYSANYIFQIAILLLFILYGFYFTIKLFNRSERHLIKVLLGSELKRFIYFA